MTMIQICFSGLPKEELDAMGVDLTQCPPWFLCHVGLLVDFLLTPLYCRDVWRHYLPASLSSYFDEDYSLTAIVSKLPNSLSWSEFRKLQGYAAGSYENWSTSLYEYLIETPSTALCNLWTPTSLLTVATIVLLIRLLKSVIMPQFQSLGQHLALKFHGPEWHDDERILKFGEQVYRLLYHSFISIIGWYYFADAPWWQPGNTRTLFTDFPHDPVPPGMSWYYIFQASYYVDAMLELCLISLMIEWKNEGIKLQYAPTIRGDFREMMVHHVVTLSLIYLSSFFRQSRIGSMVFWMHDISDVPVDVAKLCNFVKFKAGTAVAFVIMAAVWFYTRLYIFPTTILGAIYYESYEVARNGFPVFLYMFQPLFLLLLGTLIALHAVWFSIILRMGYYLVAKGETHDLVEHKDGEEQGGVVLNTNGKNSATTITATNGNGKKTN